MQQSSSNKFFRIIIKWGLYPFSWFVVLVSFHLMHTTEVNPKLIWAICIGTLAAIYLLIEWSFPLEERWKMSLRSFLADFKFAILNTVFVSGLSSVLAIFAIGISFENVGLATDWSLPIQLLVCLLIFEAINYTIHRLMHESGGKLGRILWRTHAVHHLPPKLYLIMHAVFHPLNGMAIQAFAIILPIWFMGYSVEAVTMFLIINGMHGLISHFNVDVRMGFMNYIFVGPELHRYHHSANVNEAKNYAATLSIYDILFGTFVYHPGQFPDELGVSEASGLPSYERYFEVLKLPFTK